MDTIGERIQQIRKSKKLTQTEFGKMFGVTHAHISSIERGKDKPSEMFILFIIEKLKINETWLRTGKGKMDDHYEGLVDGFFDGHSVQGLMIKYNHIIDHITEYLQDIDKDELNAIVWSLSYFQLRLICSDINDGKKRQEYLNELEKLTKTMDILFSEIKLVSDLNNGRKIPYQSLLLISVKSNELIKEINSCLRNILNIYIDVYAKFDKDYKIF